MFKNVDFLSLKAVRSLVTHFEEIKKVSMKDLFSSDSSRVDAFSVDIDGCYFDYSKNRIDKEGVELLLDMCDEANLTSAIEAMMEGERINKTENRAVLHTALRSVYTQDLDWEGNNISEEIKDVLKQMKVFSEQVIGGLWKGYTGKPIETIVNIGIGGSDLGPRMVVEALSADRNHLKTHFVSNVDGWQLHSVLQQCDPATTLFVIVSKTFTTQETMANAEAARNWLLQEFEDSDAVAQHFVAVSTNIEATAEFGIGQENVFGFWEWVGGRYSLWSAVGLSIVLSVGFSKFEELLKGASWADHHFRETKFESNIPVIMALLGIWYNNFFGCEAQAVLPYDQRLSQFPAYLQQADMESNGKSVGRDGTTVSYQTGPIIWGEPGTNGQHAFYQLLHQGTKMVPCDFIAFNYCDHDLKSHHEKLLANCVAQAEALMVGKSAEQVTTELHEQGKSEREIQFLLPHKVFEGNRPSNMLWFDRLSPFNLGRLIAIYEHKIFVQGYLWNLFSFDQWGVELGKQLAGKILEEVQSNQKLGNHDESTSRFINRIKGH